MSEKGWKRTERKIAEVLGGRRVPVSGRQYADALAVIRLEDLAEWLAKSNMKGEEIE